MATHERKRAREAALKAEVGMQKTFPPLDVFCLFISKPSLISCLPVFWGSAPVWMLEQQHSYLRCILVGTA